MIPLRSGLALKLVAAACAALLLALLVHDRNRWKGVATLRQEQLVAEKHAHSATVANYSAAAERARREDGENAARVKATQDAINERTADEFETRIAAARAAAERLRLDSGPASDPGSSPASTVPVLSAAAQRAVEAAGEGGLSRSDRLLATEQAIQLDELIKWVRRQAAVPVNGGSDQSRIGVQASGE